MDSTKALSFVKVFSFRGTAGRNHGGLHPSSWFRTRMGSVKPWKDWGKEQELAWTPKLPRDLGPPPRLGTSVLCPTVH